MFHLASQAKWERDKVTEWDGREKKEEQQHNKKKKKGDKELLMAYSTSGQESKWRQITTWSEKSRKQINVIYSVGHKAGRKAMYNEGTRH